MRRRHALQGVATVVCAVPGCIGSSTPQTETTRTKTETTDEDTEHAFGDEVAVDGLGTVVIRSVTVQRSVIHHHLWRSLFEPADAQLLVLTGRIPDAADPEFDIRFNARIDGEVIESAERTWLGTDDRVYALSVPIETVTDAAVVLQAGAEPAWTLPETVTEQLATAPEFHLHDATIREDDGTILELTVENRGTRDGVFRGVAKHASAADADSSIRIPVATGETITESVQPSVLSSWVSDADFGHEITPETRVFSIA